MSNATMRADLAALLDTIDGLRGHKSRPSAPKAGDAWPQWSGAERADGWATVNTWRIMIILDQGSEASADAAADRWGDDLVEILSPRLFVSAITPAELSTAAGPLYALMITGRAE